MWLLAVFLLATIGGGMVRVVLGPSREDRIVAALLFGTTGVALLLVLADIRDSPATRDVALVLAVLAAVVTMVFTQAAHATVTKPRAPGGPDGPDRGKDGPDSGAGRAQAGLLDGDPGPAAE